MKRWQRLCLSQIHLGIAGVNGVKMAPSATAAATTVINFPVGCNPQRLNLLAQGESTRRGNILKRECVPGLGASHLEHPKGLIRSGVTRR
jgi:hypothetical protein